jgi:DNA helicase-2/ATP-dependent DNA helicase PcrA
MPVDLSRLNPPQKEAALITSGPLLVLAGAGTGKTRVITHRIAHLIDLGVDPRRILAVTFTNKAAGEMRKRIDELAAGAGALVWCHTFHAFCARLLRTHYAKLNLAKHFTIYDQSDQKKLVTEAMKEIGLGEQTNKAGMYVSIISRAKDDLLDAQSYAIHAMTMTDASRETAAKIYVQYQKKLDAAGALDFGDLLLKTCVLLREHKDVREYYQDLFEHLHVDEYQDTNHAQYILTKTLAAKHRNVCVVGDDDQSVYSWRGANIRNILEFERDFTDAKVVTLEQNYRSTALILEAAGKVIRNNKSRKVKTLWTEKPAGDSVRVNELPSELEEGNWVVRCIDEEIHRGRSLSEIAIFYRTNAQSRSFEESLRRAGLPYVIVGAMRFYERKEIKDVLAYARMLLNPADSTSLERALSTPSRGLGKTSLDRLKGYAASETLSLWDVFGRHDQVPDLTSGARRAVREFVFAMEKLRKDIEGLPASQAIVKIMEDTGYWKELEDSMETDPEASGRLDNLTELVNSVKEYEEKAKQEGRLIDLGQYLVDVSLQTDLDAYDASKPAITLMTVHLAKGLEYPVVFLTGLEEGLFPIGSGNAAPEDLEEERRLAYVGITRARERLYITWCSTRRIFGQIYANLPSRFILEAQLLPNMRTPQQRLAPAPASNPSFPARPLPAGLAAAPAASTGRSLAQAGVKVGQRVRHPQFGVGSVVDKAGSGDTLKVTVHFDNGRVTKLLVRFAPLEAA